MVPFRPTTNVDGRQRDPQFSWVLLPCYHKEMMCVVNAFKFERELGNVRKGIWPRMSRVGAIIALTWVGGACGKSYPPPSPTTVEASSSGLQSLFATECLRQRHINWVLQEVQSRRSSCTGPLTSRGREGDCLEEVDEHKWRQPLNGSGNVWVVMNWPISGDAPSAPLNCEIRVAPALEPMLKQAAIGIANSIGWKGPVRPDQALTKSDIIHQVWSIDGAIDRIPRLEIRYLAYQDGDVLRKNPATYEYATWVNDYPWVMRYVVKENWGAYLYQPRVAITPVQ